MSKIIYITGGARSGKSSFGQQLAEENSSNPIYLATARIWDDDFRERVSRHQADRGSQWTTLEKEKGINELNLEGKTVLLDCITLWLTNIFYANKNNIECTLTEAKKEWDEFLKNDFNLIVISNELGMGIHPEHESARKFIDLQGWMNQYISKTANEVYLMVSGISTQLK